MAASEEQEDLLTWDTKRQNHNQEAKQPPQMSDPEIDSAIRELSSLSNPDLRDIDRGIIRHSVMHGLALQEHRKAA